MFLCIVSLLWWLTSSILLYFFLIYSITITTRLVQALISRERPVDPKDVVLITGATSGLGLALAKHLYSLGYSVIACYFNSKEPGYQELVRLSENGVRKQGNKLELVELDVRNDQSISGAYEQVEKWLKAHELSLYAIINNAGIGSLLPFAFLPRKCIRNLIDTNLTGSLLVTRNFLPLLVERASRSPDARIINNSSGLAFVPGSTYATYGSTKTALVYFTRCLNLELKSSYNIKSICVIPHNLIKNTNIMAHGVAQNEAAWQELKPLERQLYGEEFMSHKRRIRSLEDASREFNKQMSNYMRKAAESKRDQADHRYATGSFKKIFDQLTDVFAKLIGKGNAQTIEDSGAVEGFVTALRSDSPPELIFSGELSYSYLVGSLLLALPSSLTAMLLGGSVAPSLYR